MLVGAERRHTRLARTAAVKGKHHRGTTLHSSPAGIQQTVHWNWKFRPGCDVRRDKRFVPQPSDLGRNWSTYRFEVRMLSARTNHLKPHTLKYGVCFDPCAMGLVRTHKYRAVAHVSDRGTLKTFCKHWTKIAEHIGRTTRRHQAPSAVGTPFQGSAMRLAHV